MEKKMRALKEGRPGGRLWGRTNYELLGAENKGKRWVSRA